MQKILSILFISIFIFSVYSEDVFCQPGEYLNNGEKEFCPSGYYCPGDGMKYECPDGTFSEERSESINECKKCGCKNGKKCQKGTVKKWYGKTIDAGYCSGKEPCKPGYGFNEEGHYCYPCFKRTVSKGGKSRCISCGRNEYSNENFTECIKCPFGQAYIEGECQGCPIGQYFDTEEERCYWCPDDSYADKPGQIECQKCPPGMYKNENGNGCTYQQPFFHLINDFEIPWYYNDDD